MPVTTSLLAACKWSSMLKSMSRSWSRRFVALLVGLCFAVAMGLSPVQANDMAAKMAAADQSPCADCKGDMAAMGCGATACSAAMPALTAQPVFAIDADRLAAVSAAPAVLRGRERAPDPHPPRSNASL